MLWIKGTAFLLYFLAVLACVVLWYVWVWSFSVHTIVYLIFISAGTRAAGQRYRERRDEQKNHPLAYAALAQKRFGKD